MCFVETLVPAVPLLAPRPLRDYDPIVDREEIIAKLRVALSSMTVPPLAAWLFGSVARGAARQDSDVDVAVLLGHPPPKTLIERFTPEGMLEGALGLPVHFVVLDTAPVDLVHRVLRDGVLLTDRDSAARVRFEVAARNAYFDLLPVLQLYRRTGTERKSR
jgi:uncharacterized protein